VRPEQRQRAEVAGAVSGAKLYLAEVRAASLRRAADIEQLLAKVEGPGRLRAFLQGTQRNLLLITEAAEAALADFDDVSISDLLADIRSSYRRMS
jgi:hypothetical protein